MKKLLFSLISGVLMLANTANCQELFSKVYYDDVSALYSTSVVETYDNGYIIGGKKGTKFIRYKIDSNGDIQWYKIESSSGLYIFDMIGLADSNYLCFGYKNSVNVYDQNAFCMKFDNNGDTIWTNFIKYDSSSLIFSALEDSDNNILLLGRDAFFHDPGNLRICITKLDTDGNLIWSKAYTDGIHRGFATSIIETPDNGYSIFGYYDGDDPLKQAFVMKTDNDGEVEWVKKYLMIYQIANTRYDHILVNDGYMYATQYKNKLVLMKTDFDGNVIWSKKYYTYSYLEYGGMVKIYEQNDGNFVVLVRDNLVKVDSSGNIIWTKEILMRIEDMVMTPEDGFLIVGNGPIGSLQNSEIGIIKTDSDGNGDCINDTDIISYDFTFDNFSSSIPSFDLGSLCHETIQFTTTDFLYNDGCVSVISQVEEEDINNEISIYPNPSHGIIYINTTDFNNISCVSVFNTMGEIVYQNKILDQQTSKIDLKSNPSGIYILKISNGNNIAVRKIYLY